jgi:organic hydroperoxide reductase OsmC/OhrA
MKPYPHHYLVDAHAAATGHVDLRAEGLLPIASAPPLEFDGPGDQWSPESLLVAAVVDCFVLTFRAIARASKLEWTDIRCHAEGTLDRIERVTRFTGLRIVAELILPAGGNAEIARRLLEKAEHECLVTNSLNVPVELDARVIVSE